MKMPVRGGQRGVEGGVAAGQRHGAGVLQRRTVHVPLHDGVGVIDFIARAGVLALVAPVYACTRCAPAWVGGAAVEFSGGGQLGISAVAPAGQVAVSAEAAAVGLVRVKDEFRPRLKRARVARRVRRLCG